MLSKLGHCGIKFWILTDCASHYCYNITPYLGIKGDKAATNLGEKIVKNLVVHIFGSRTNITCHQYFTSVALIEELLQKILTALGTLIANRKHLSL